MGGGNGKESIMVQGVIVWGSVVVINLVVLLILQFARKSRYVPVKDIFLAALISDVIVHLIVAFISNIGEMIMWAMISFPLVGVVSLLVCLLAKYGYERVRHKHVSDTPNG